MKKIHIVLLVLVAVAISSMTVLFGKDFGTYETFASAESNPGKDVQVIAYFEKDQPIVYDPLTDPNHFTFFAKFTLLLKPVVYGRKSCIFILCFKRYLSYS